MVIGARNEFCVLQSMAFMCSLFIVHVYKIENALQPHHERNLKQNEQVLCSVSTTYQHHAFIKPTQVDEVFRFCQLITVVLTLDFEPLASGDCSK